LPGWRPWTATNAVPGTGNGGGLNNYGGTATLTGSIFTGNVASSGGGIYSTGPLTVTDCQITGNNASSVSGGGIYASGTARISRSTITGNSAGSGGGIYFYRGAPGTLTLADSTVANNRVTGAGGGIYVS
jgi:predicted outer membrane repeat protein